MAIVEESFSARDLPGLAIDGIRFIGDVDQDRLGINAIVEL